MAAEFTHSRRPCVKHSGHGHPLRPIDVKEDEIICSGCELDLSGSAYKCTKSRCDFFLHRSCFELPRELEHSSHPKHHLTLLHLPPSKEDSSKFTCNACADYSTAFNYHCSACQFSIHVGCAFLPQTMRHQAHDHPLALFYSSSLERGATTFSCDVCRKQVPPSCWIYYCPDCDYGTDLACVAPPHK